MSETTATNWFERIKASEHEMEMGDQPHPGDVAAMWCTRDECADADGIGPEWPCPGLLAELGVPDVDAFWRADSAAVDVLYGFEPGASS